MLIMKNTSDMLPLAACVDAAFGPTNDFGPDGPLLDSIKIEEIEGGYQVNTGHLGKFTLKMLMPGAELTGVGASDDFAFLQRVDPANILPQSDEFAPFEEFHRRLLAVRVPLARVADGVYPGATDDNVRYISDTLSVVANGAAMHSTQVGLDLGGLPRASVRSTIAATTQSMPAEPFAYTEGILHWQGGQQGGTRLSLHDELGGALTDLHRGLSSLYSNFFKE